MLSPCYRRMSGLHGACKQRTLDGQSVLLSPPVVFGLEEGCGLTSRLRAAVVVPLGGVAAEPAEVVGLDFGFDTFSDHGEAETHEASQRYC